MLIGYARVSTLEQDPDLQVRALKAAGCAKIFEERASGAKSERPQLTAALSHLREGDTLCVWRLDRLGRNMRHLIETVETLKDQGVEFRSLTEGIDTTTIGGELVFGIFSAFAQFERNLIRERTMAGLSAARVRGRKGGRPRALTDGDVRAAQAMLSDPDIRVTEVAERFGVHVSTLHAYLADARAAKNSEHDK